MGIEQRGYRRKGVSPRPRNTSVEALEARAAVLLDSALRGFLPPRDREKLVRGSRIFAPPREPIEPVQLQTSIPSDLRRYMAGRDPLPETFVNEVLGKIFDKEPNETDPDYAQRVTRTLYRVSSVRRDLIRRTYVEGYSLEDAAVKLELSMTDLELQKSYNQAILKLAGYLGISLSD